MSSTTQKRRNFASEPMTGKLITEVPGIGPAFGERLRNVGIKTAKKIYQVFLKKGKDRDKFVTWFLEACLTNGRYRRNAYECFESLEEWDKQFGSLGKPTSSNYDSDETLDLK